MVSPLHRLRHLWYLAVGVTRVPGLQLDRAWWEADYERGGLARIEGDTELPRYLLVAALVRRYAPGGSVLDIGCGTGGLAAPLGDAFGDRLEYTGLDYSELALALARERVAAHPGRPAGASFAFAQGDFDTHEIARPVDAVVFNEALYYAPDPVRTLRRYRAGLSADGVVIVSMWRHPTRQRLWRTIARELRQVSRSRVTVPRRPAWDISVYTAP